MAKLKIALMVPGGVDRAGVKIVPALVALIRRLARDHEVHAFALRQEPEPGEWSLAGARIHNLGLSTTPMRAFRAVSSEHRKAPFQVMQSIWAGPVGALAVGAGSLLRVPSFVHVAGGELAALGDIGYGGRRSWRGRAMQTAVLRLADQVTAASTMICDLIARVGVVATRLPLGVDIESWPPKAPVARGADTQPQLIHIADLNRVKDQPTLLRALRALADRGREFHADFVGVDTLSGEIQTLATELGLSERIRFHGFLPQTRIRPLVEAAHIALISSRHEAGPVVALEAALAGVPTVGTAVGHIAEWHPHAALAVPCQSPTALADGIESLIDDDALRLRLASDAQNRALEMDADATAAAFLRLYEQSLNARSS